MCGWLRLGSRTLTHTHTPRIRILMLSLIFPFRLSATLLVRHYVCACVRYVCEWVFCVPISPLLFPCSPRVDSLMLIDISLLFRNLSDIVVVAAAIVFICAWFSTASPFFSRVQPNVISMCVCVCFCSVRPIDKMQKWSRFFHALSSNSGRVSLPHIYFPSFPSQSTTHTHIHTYIFSIGRCNESSHSTKWLCSGARFINVLSEHEIAAKHRSPSYRSTTKNKQTLKMDYVFVDFRWISTGSRRLFNAWTVYFEWLFCTDILHSFKSGRYGFQIRSAKCGLGNRKFQFKHLFASSDMLH